MKNKPPVCPYCRIEKKRPIPGTNRGGARLMASYGLLIGILDYGDHKRFTQIQINYCPMCGRRIRKEKR